MTPCPSRAELERWLNEEGAAPANACVAIHVEDCADCQARVERMLSETMPARCRGSNPSCGSAPPDESNSFLLKLSARPPGIHDGDGVRTPTPCRVDTARAGEPPPAIPGYDVVEEIGRGGMGIVYKARHRSLNRFVALKLIHGRPGLQPHMQARLGLEAEAAARLQHPNIVQIHEIGECSRGPYLALEYVEIGNLSDRIKGAQQPIGEATDLVATLARATQYAHEQGIIHRDLKPANVLLSANAKTLNDRRDHAGSPWASGRFPLVSKISDFGLARFVGDRTVPSTSDALVGTPSYMAPEQANGKFDDAGAAVDIYSLGAILYEMLTGRPPFTGETSYDTVLQVLHELPVAPRWLRPQLPLDLETICLKCLSKESSKRYGSAAELADDLERFLAGRPILARPVSAAERCWRWCRRNPAIAGLLAALGLAIVLGFTGVLWKWRDADSQRRRAVDLANSTDAALRREQIERHDKEIALSTAKSNLYFHSVALAHREWQANNLGNAEQILDQCPPEFRNWEWHYLKSLCHDESAILSGCGDSVQAIVFSPDGQRLAAAAANGTVTIWDANTHRKLQSFNGVPANYSLLRFGPEGDCLVRVSKRVTPGAPFASDTTLAVWNTRTGEPVFERRDPFVGYKLAINQDATRLIAATTGGAASVWDIQTGTELAKLPFRMVGAAAPAITPDGKLIAGIDANGRLSLFAAADGALVRNLEKPEQRIVSIDFSPDGRLLADAREQSICIWDVATGRKVSETIGGVGGNHSVQFAGNGNWLLIRSGRRDVQIQSTSRSNNAAVVRMNTPRVTSAAVNPDGTIVAIGCPDGLVRLCDIDRLDGARSIKRLPNQRYACLSPDGMKLAAMNQDTVTLRDGATGKSIGFLKLNLGSFPVALSHNGSHIVCAGPDSGFSILDVKSGQEIRKLPGRNGQTVRLLPASGNLLLPRHAGKFAVFSRDDRRLVTASDRAGIQIWNASTGQEVCTVDSHRVIGIAPALSADGHRLAFAGTGGAIGIVDSDTQPRELAAHAGYCRALEFDPTGNLLASGGSDALVKVWESITGREQFSLAGHTDIITALAFTADATRLASASYDKSVKIWDVKSRREILTLTGFAAVPIAIRFSADGSRLVVLDGRGDVRVFDASHDPKSSIATNP